MVGSGDVAPANAMTLAAEHFPCYTNPVQDDAVDAMIAIHISPLASGMVNEDPGKEVWLRGCFGGRDRSGAEHGEGGDHTAHDRHDESESIAARYVMNNPRGPWSRCTASGR